MLNRNILLLIFASCENYEFEMNAEQPSLERLFCKAMKRCKKENSHPNTKKNNVQWNYNIYRSDIYTLDKTEGENPRMDTQETLHGNIGNTRRKTKTDNTTQKTKQQ
jgi:hypothetical protein